MSDHIVRDRIADIACRQSANQMDRVTFLGTSIRNIRRVGRHQLPYGQGKYNRLPKLL